MQCLFIEVGAECPLLRDQLDERLGRSDCGGDRISTAGAVTLGAAAIGVADAAGARRRNLPNIGETSLPARNGKSSDGGRAASYSNCGAGRGMRATRLARAFARRAL